MFKKVSAVLLVMVLILSIFSGCTKDTSNNQTDAGDNTGSTVSAETDKETSADTEPAEAESNEVSDLSEIKSGGILRIGTGQNPPVVGYTPEITNNSFIQFARCSFDSLIFYNEDGSFSPELAERWDVDSEKAIITFHLRKDVKFQDGTDFNAEAVKWNIEQYQSVSRTEVANIESIECPDASTVIVNLKEWSSSSLESIGFFVYYMSPTAFENNGGVEWARMNPVGTGPFKLESFEQGVSIKYVKSDNYWQEGKPYLDGVEYSIISDATTLENTLISGDIDLISYASIDQMNNLLNNDTFEQEKNQNGVGVESTGIIVSSVKEDSPFFDAKVRQAFCYAINADDIVAALGYGLLTRTNQWAAPNAVTFNKDLDGNDYNPEKAKELLKEAGFADGFDTTLWCPSGFDNWATAISDNLLAVGINAKIEIVDGAKAFDFMKNGWDGIFFHWASIGPDLGLYMGRHLDVNGAYYAKGIQHPEDALQLLQEVRTAKDDTTKIAKELELQKVIYDKYALFGKTLYVTPVAAIKQKYVINDNYTKYHNAAWTPAETWLDK